MTRSLSRLLSGSGGATAAEFAMVLPLLLLLLVGMIDVGRLLWTLNRAEKATQMGVRYAITTDMVASGLADYAFTETGLVQGAPIPADRFGGVTCDSTTCTNKGAGPAPGYSATAFNNILARMRLFMPEIQPQNLIVEYDHSGLGYAGDPNAPDVAALTTVRLTGITFQPYLLLGGSIQLPGFHAALTMEDGSGTVAN